MRKLKVQMNIELEGKWDGGMSAFSIGNLDNVDCILHGRKTAEGFIPYWAEVASNLADAEYKLGKRIAEIPNAVFSNTLPKNYWDNTVVISGGLHEEMIALKSKAGQAIMVYGGESFVRSLINFDLVDELYLLVNPACFGTGKPVFNPLTEKLQLSLMKAETFDCGAILLCYKRRELRDGRGM